MERDSVEQLVAATVAAFPRFVWRRLEGLGLAASSDLDGVIGRSTADLRKALQSLLAMPAGQQDRSPLELVREATREITSALQGAGSKPVDRDLWESNTHPEDLFGLYPASPAELGEQMLQVHLLWGQAKAAAVTGEQPPPVAPRQPGVVLFGIPLGGRDQLQQAIVERGYRVLIWRNPAALEGIASAKPMLAIVDRRHPAAERAIRTFNDAGVRIVATSDYLDDLMKPGLLALGADEVLELGRIVPGLDRLLPRLV